MVYYDWSIFGIKLFCFSRLVGLLNNINFQVLQMKAICFVLFVCLFVCLFVWSLHSSVCFFLQFFCLFVYPPIGYVFASLSPSVLFVCLLVLYFTLCVSACTCVPDWLSSVGPGDKTHLVVTINEDKHQSSFFRIGQCLSRSQKLVYSPT